MPTVGLDPGDEKVPGGEEQKVKTAPASMEARDFMAMERMSRPSLMLEQMRPGFNRLSMHGKMAVVQLLEMAAMFGGFGEPASLLKAFESRRNSETTGRSDRRRD